MKQNTDNAQTPESCLASVSGSSEKHPKCKGFKYWTDCGYEFDCGYDSTVDCDECKYGGGRKDPEAKCNQNYR
jgi:hypothetical protein